MLCKLDDNVRFVLQKNRRHNSQILCWTSGVSQNIWTSSAPAQTHPSVFTFTVHGAEMILSQFERSEPCHKFKNTQGGLLWFIYWKEHHLWICIVRNMSSLFPFFFADSLPQHPRGLSHHVPQGLQPWGPCGHGQVPGCPGPCPVWEVPVNCWRTSAGWRMTDGEQQRGRG